MNKKKEIIPVCVWWGNQVQITGVPLVGVFNFAQWRIKHPSEWNWGWLCELFAEVCASLSEWGSRLYSCRVVILPCSGDNYTIYCLPWGVKQTALPAVSRGLKILMEWKQIDQGCKASVPECTELAVSVNAATPTGYIWLNMTCLPRWVAQCWLEMENARVLGREWNTAEGEVIPSQSGECKIHVAQACTLWLELFWHFNFHNALKFRDSQLLGESWRENFKLSFVNKSAHFFSSFSRFNVKFKCWPILAKTVLSPFWGGVKLWSLSIQEPALSSEVVLFL